MIRFLLKLDGNNNKKVFPSNKKHILLFMREVYLCPRYDEILIQYRIQMIICQKVCLFSCILGGTVSYRCSWYASANIFANTFTGDQEGCYHEIAKASKKNIISELQRYLLHSSITRGLSGVFKADKLIEENMKIAEC